jgi:hypothetical protein
MIKAGCEEYNIVGSVLEDGKNIALIRIINFLNS